MESNNPSKSPSFSEKVFQNSKQKETKPLTNWKHLLQIIGGKSDLRERIVTEMTSMAVVSSLIGGLAYSIFVSPPERLRIGDSLEHRVFGILSGLALIFSVFCVLTSTLILIQINLVDNLQLGGWFIHHWEFTTAVNFTFFVGSILTLLGTMCFITLHLYDVLVATILISVIFIGTVWIMCTYIWMDLHRKEHNMKVQKPSSEEKKKD